MEAVSVRALTLGWPAGLGPDVGAPAELGAGREEGEAAPYLRGPHVLRHSRQSHARGWMGPARLGMQRAVRVASTAAS